MDPPPAMISGARVVCYSPIDERHRPTGNCRHFLAGSLTGPADGLAICQYPGEDCYYLFGCDVSWENLTDTWHRCLEDAQHQAEFEYEGVSRTWKYYESESESE